MLVECPTWDFMISSGMLFIVCRSCLLFLILQKLFLRSRKPYVLRTFGKPFIGFVLGFVLPFVPLQRRCKRLSHAVTLHLDLDSIHTASPTLLIFISFPSCKKIPAEAGKVKMSFRLNRIIEIIIRFTRLPDGVVGDVTMIPYRDI